MYVCVVTDMPIQLLLCRKDKIRDLLTRKERETRVTLLIFLSPKGCKRSNYTRCFSKWKKIDSIRDDLKRRYKSPHHFNFSKVNTFPPFLFQQSQIVFVFLEWRYNGTTQQAEEVTALEREKNLQVGSNIVGLQIKIFPQLIFPLITVTSITKV